MVRARARQRVSEVGVSEGSIFVVVGWWGDGAVWMGGLGAWLRG